MTVLAYTILMIKQDYLYYKINHYVLRHTMMYIITQDIPEILKIIIIYSIIIAI
jgi:hypothetical protein